MCVLISLQTMSETFLILRRIQLDTIINVPPTEPCALRSTQPLKVSTRDFSWGKGSWCVWLTTYHPCSAEMSRKSGALNYPEPLGPPRPVVGHLYLYFTIINVHKSSYKVPIILVRFKKT